MDAERVSRTGQSATTSYLLGYGFGMDMELRNGLGFQFAYGGQMVAARIPSSAPWGFTSPRDRFRGSGRLTLGKAADSSVPRQRALPYVLGDVLDGADCDAVTRSAVTCRDSASVGDGTGGGNHPTRASRDRRD